jgi:hypothetical protein
MVTRQGGCGCGAIRYQVMGEPTMVGICHCTTCRKETGSVFMAYADWPLEAFTTTGEVRTFEGRSFCPVCGSRLYSVGDDHVEIKIGTLDDAPNNLIPQEEIWVKRRESWLKPLEGAQRHREDPPRVQARLERERERR